MTDSFGFDDDKRYANRIEPIREELAAANPNESVIILYLILFRL